MWLGRETGHDSVRLMWLGRETGHDSVRLVWLGRETGHNRDTAFRFRLSAFGFPLFRPPMPRDFLQGVRDHYDVVVIGSGLAGLTAAHVLGRAGYSVLVLEQHYKLGGLATWFRRPGGHVFDISLHGFPVGMIKSCRRYWNDEIADLIVPVPNIRYDNPMFSLTTAFDREDFKRLLTGRFGVAPAAVGQFFDTVWRASTRDNSTLTTGDLLNRFFPGREDVVRLLHEPITYANGSGLEDPASAFGIVFSNFMSKGIFTFAGGTDQLIPLMQKSLASHGVDARVRCDVERVVVERGRVTGVVVNGRLIGTRAVVSNANLRSTIFRLVGAEHFDRRFVDEAEAVRMNCSSTQVFMAFKPERQIDESTGDILFSSTAPRFRTDLVVSPDVTSRTFTFYYPKLRPAAEPRCLVVSSTNARFEDWADLTKGEYEDRKRHLIEGTIDALEKYVPDVRRDLDHVEAATPITFRHYTRHVDGASFGTKFEGLAVSRALPEQIRGLYHAGSVGIIMSGWLGVINYGVIVANDVDLALMRCAATAAATS